MTDKIDDGGPAFPSTYSTGLTKRDWFAGQALPAIIAATSAGQHHPLRGEDTAIVKGVLEAAMARDAYAMADAMLAERAKK